MDSGIYKARSRSPDQILSFTNYLPTHQSSQNPDETLQPLPSAAAGGESLLESTRPASCEAAGQQVTDSPHSNILLDGSLSPRENHGSQLPFNAVTLEDTIQNPIRIDDGKDGQPVQSVEPSHRLKRKRRLLPLTSITHKLISNMVIISLSFFSLPTNDF